MNTEVKDIKETWNNLIQFIKQTTGKKPADLNGVLFLIGVQELGKGTITFSINCMMMVSKSFTTNFKFDFSW